MGENEVQRCGRCKVDTPLTGFNPSKRGVLGASCKPCIRRYQYERKNGLPITPAASNDLPEIRCVVCDNSFQPKILRPSRPSMYCSKQCKERKACAKPCVVDGCSERRLVGVKSQRCERHTGVLDGRWRNSDGYVILEIDLRDGSRWGISEHRFNMMRKLGRELINRENVHHINGVRDDNRVENLELWYTSQPSGQRVPDLVSYLIEFHHDALIAALGR